MLPPQPISPAPEPPSDVSVGPEGRARLAESLLHALHAAIPPAPRAQQGGAHVLLAVALQEEQVGRLVDGAAHGVLAGLLGAPGSGWRGGGRAQAGLADRAAQPGRRRAPGSPRGRGWGSLGAAPLQSPGLGVYPCGRSSEG